MPCPSRRHGSSGTSTRTTRSSCTGVESAEKIDPKHVEFTGKIWGIRRNWEAKITEKRTNEVVAWTSEDGLENSGVVTFHRMGPRLTRIELNLDIAPHGPIEKIGRGMRFTKRAVRADLHRFKAYAEMNEALMKAPKTVVRAASERLGGGRPSVMRASVTAVGRRRRRCRHGVPRASQLSADGSATQEREPRRALRRPLAGGVPGDEDQAMAARLQ